MVGAPTTKTTFRLRASARRTLNLSVGVLVVAGSDMKNNRLLLGVVVLLGVVTATWQLLPSSQQTTSVETLPPTTTTTSTIPVTTTSVPAVPSTTTPKRQVTTTVTAAPKTKTPTVTGTPSEILDKLRADVLAMERQIMSSGNFGSLDPKRAALSAKYSGAATLTYNRAVSGGNYTAKSIDLTQVWYVELDDYGDIILVDR